MTAETAAHELGYTLGVYVTRHCREGKIPGAYREGRIWLVPTKWVEAKKAEDAARGIVRGENAKIGRPVTTGAGLRRKRQYPYQPTGRPPGRPRKAATPPPEDPSADPSEQPAAAGGL